MTGRANIAGVRVMVDGVDITPKLEERVGTARRRRLISLGITEKRGEEADQLDIVVDDSDGGMALPKAGKRISVAIGWLQGIGVTTGLIEKGSFVVEDVEHSGPPDQVTIRARAADFTSEIRTRRDASWHDTTLGQVVVDIAKRNKLEPRCAPALAGIRVAALAQSRQADIAFLRRLGRAHDALASVKDGKLILSPVGALTTTTGRELPFATIRRRDGDRHAFRIQKPEEATKVEATYHDRRAGKPQVVAHGTGGKTKRVGRTYGTKEAAERAARAEHGRAARKPYSLDLNLALGDAALYPDQRVAASGFKPEIDATKWLISEVSHTIGDRGFMTAVKLEAA